MLIFNYPRKHCFLAFVIYQNENTDCWLLVFFNELVDSTLLLILCYVPQQTISKHFVIFDQIGEPWRMRQTQLCVPQNHIKATR